MINLKKMSKIIKKFLYFKKEKKGNITILILIMGMAVILLTTAMVGYIFRDIGFTELDKDKLRALNFAEAGISNMYSNIDQYNKGFIQHIPDDDPEETFGYTRDVYSEGNPDPEGSFTIEYEAYFVGGSYLIDGYEITSKGIDIGSGAERAVKVNTVYMDIYDFIYSGEAMGSGQIAGQTTISGPFFVAGNFGLLTGNSNFIGGPLFVMGDIEITGSCSIGEPSNPIVLFLGGKMNGSIFDPNNPPGGVYVSEYYDSVIEIIMPIIDDNYINSVVASGALVINGNLSINEYDEGGITVNDLPPPSEVDDYLWYNGSGILEINGNIVVYGDITIGGHMETIRYSGKANLVSTGNIIIDSQIIPNGFIDFPEDDLIALISKNNIDLFLTNEFGGTYNDPGVAAMLIAGNKTETSTNTFIRGSSISNALVLGQNTQIYYEEGIGKVLVTGVPGFNGKIFVLNWQEIIVE